VLGQNPVPPELKAQLRGDVPASPLRGVPFLGHPTAGARDEKSGQQRTEEVARMQHLNDVP